MIVIFCPANDRRIFAAHNGNCRPSAKKRRAIMTFFEAQGDSPFHFTFEYDKIGKYVLKLQEDIRKAESERK
jgi:hypothetical protein